MAIIPATCGIAHFTGAGDATKTQLWHRFAIHHRFTELILSMVAFGVAAELPHLLGLTGRWIGLICGLYFLLGAFGMVYYSKVGKLKLRNQLLDSIPAWG
ncbi:MAG: hypothetical protein J2P21_15065 [Chloracidobacterium sp.]|nr:hypothetical protein [Chloracidobacterium sp.]